MRFLMISLGSNTTVLTDDYSEREIACNAHIRHLRRDIDLFGLKYPCKVYDPNMKLVCTFKSPNS